MDRNRQVVDQWAERIGRGDLAEDLWDPDLEIVNAEGWAIEATYRGHEGLCRWWADLEEAFSDFGMEVDEIEQVDAERFLTTQRFVGRFRATGIPFDGQWAGVVTIREGRIVHARGYLSKSRALRALRDEVPETREIEDFVRSAYDRFNREKRAFPDLWHPEGEYVNSRDDPDHGVHRGLEAIARLTGQWVEAYPDLRVEPLEIRVSGNRVFAWTHWSGQGGASGAPMDMELAHVFTLEGDKIRRMEEFFDREEGLAAAGLSD